MQAGRTASPVHLSGGEEMGMTEAVKRSVFLDPSLFLPETAAEETLAFNREIERQSAELPPVHTVPPDVVRAARREEGGIFPPLLPLREGSRWHSFEGAPGGPGRLRISEPDGKPVGVYVHIHGGGWTLGTADEFDQQNQLLAARAGVIVASVSYRLAPENPWPAGAEDCEAALRYVLAHAEDLFGTDRIAIGGESAGAHLVAISLQRCRDVAVGRISGAVLTYGCYDLRLTPSARQWGDRRLVLSTPSIEWFAGNLLADRATPEDPAVSPLLGDLSGMPPALFSVGTEDPLLDDSLFMAGRWAAAGAEAELVVYPGAMHAFDMFEELAVARAFHASEAAFLVRCLSPAAEGR